MRDYIELYDNSRLKLSGALEMGGGYSLHVELYSIGFQKRFCEFAGTAFFGFASDNVQKQYCDKLCKMHDTLTGECLIQDCEFGNEIKIFF